jgi:periplasmic protein TonB
VRGEGVRWALCAAVVAAAHGCAFFVLTTQKLNVESDAGSPIVTLELSPISAAPAPPQNDAQEDAPPDAQAAPETPVEQAAPPPAPSPDPTPPVTQAAPTPEPSPEPTPTVAQTAPTPEPSPDPTPPPPQTTNDPNPPPPATTATPDAASAPPPPASSPTPEKEAPTAVATPAPLPPKPTPEKETPTVVQAAPQSPSPPPSAPSVEAAATANVAAAPTLSPGREETNSSAVLQSWQRELIAQIERHKWFPATARGRSGVARVAFSIDRSGRLTGVRIFASSGSAALDEAALDLIRRSQPFPIPPAALQESDLSFVAPVRYLPSASR